MQILLLYGNFERSRNHYFVFKQTCKFYFYMAISNVVETIILFLNKLVLVK